MKKKRFNSVQNRYATLVQDMVYTQAGHSIKQEINPCTDDTVPVVGKEAAEAWNAIFPPISSDEKMAGILARLQQMRTNEKDNSLKAVLAGAEMANVLDLVVDHLPEEEQQAVRKALHLYWHM